MSRQAEQERVIYLSSAQTFKMRCQHSLRVSESPLPSPTCVYVHDPPSFEPQATTRPLLMTHRVCTPEVSACQPAGLLPSLTRD